MFYDERMKQVLINGVVVLISTIISPLTSQALYSGGLHGDLHRRAGVWAMLCCCWNREVQETPICGDTAKQSNRQQRGQVMMVDN